MGKKVRGCQGDNAGLNRRKFLKTAGAAAAAAGVWSTIQFAPKGYATAAEVLYTGEPFDAKGATLRLGDWPGFWEEMQHKNLIDQFEKDFNCKVQYDGAWPFVPKFFAGGTKNPPHDVTNWNLPYLFAIKRSGEDFLVPIDELLANLPNSKDLWPFATLNGLGVTYLFSQYGYAYRKDMVDPAPEGFKSFWEERFAGKRGTYITANTLQMVFFMVASKVFGDSEKDIEAGFEAMRKAMPLKISDFTGNMMTLLERGEVTICVQHDGEPYMQMDKGVPAGWTYWRELEPVLTQTKTVSKYIEPTQKALGYAFIDRSITPEYQEAIGSQLYLRPTNKTAKIPPNLASKGVENTEAGTEKLWLPPWDWYLENERKIVAETSKIFGGG